MRRETLRKELLDQGAAVVGFASVKGITGKDIAHLETAVSIGMHRRLNEDTLSLLAALLKKAARFLKSKGYRYLCIPPDSDRIKGTFTSKLYPLLNHKMAATCAGLGWIGKNGLLINPEYGPRLTLATVLTDAPYRPERPVEKSRCGNCTLCMDFCPSRAITGSEWSRSDPLVELVIREKCRSHKAAKKPTHGKPNCGLCITICPYGRNLHVVSRSVERVSDKRFRRED